MNAAKLFRPGEPPLLNDRWRFAVLWSAKSACTATLIWFINTLGRTAEARAYDRWPHNWRREVLQRSQGAVTLDDSWTVVRVIRDPYARAISSYRHILQHGDDADRIQEFLGRNLRPGYSFSEFLAFLENSNLATLNSHVWGQRHYLEDEIRPRRVINVSKVDLFADLNEFEVSVGMPVTDFEDLVWLKEVETPRRVKLVEFEGDISDLRLTKTFAEDGRDWPGNDAFLNDGTRRQIKTIYAADFAAYRDYL
jgi:hypothetical protein